MGDVPGSPSVEIRLLGPADGAVLDRVDEDVFDYAVDPRWRDPFMADPRHHLAVALSDGLVVGMASGVHYVHPDKPPELWVNEVAVSPAFQRRGLATALLETLFAHARTLGCAEAWVLTDRSNGVAQALYARTGGTEVTDGPVMFTFQLGDAG
jgi:ribosomal protein S18 acetylase RimI-like enzyme